MDNDLLDIQHLSVSLKDAPIIRDLSLTLKKGEVHAIMGPNGAGKSTLAKTLAGHPSYQITDGQVVFAGCDLLSLKPEERVHRGLWMSFQYPVEIPGVTVEQFLEKALQQQRKARGEEMLYRDEFAHLLSKKMEEMQIRPEMKDRFLHVGFSGGEMKRLEILQMALFEPKLALLDETDSGLDIDALRIVSEGINRFRSPDRSILIITHYPRLLSFVHPHRVHVLRGGTIVRSGGMDLAQDLEKKGYEWLD